MSDFVFRRSLLPRALLLAAVGLLLAACAGLIGPRELTVPLSRMQQGLERHFPLNNRAMALLELELSHPQLSLQPDGRIALALDASFAPPLSNKSWRGSFSLSGRLVIDNARNAVVISEAHIEHLAIEGVDEARQRQFAKLANLVADRMAKEIAIYSFRPEDLRVAGVQFVPTAIRTTADALIVTVAPAN